MEALTYSFVAEPESSAQILPLTAYDLAELDKQKKRTDRITLLMAGAFFVFLGYQLVVEEIGFYPALFMAVFMSVCCLGGLALGRYLIVGGIRDNIRHGLKLVGPARILAKRKFKTSYWVEIDWYFSKESGTVYLTSDQYYSVEKGDSVQIQVLPKTKSVLWLKKIN